MEVTKAKGCRSLELLLLLLAVAAAVAVVAAAAVAAVLAPPQPEHVPHAGSACIDVRGSKKSVQLRFSVRALRSFVINPRFGKRSRKPPHATRFTVGGKDDGHPWHRWMHQVHLRSNAIQMLIFSITCKARTPEAVTYANLGLSDGPSWHTWMHHVEMPSRCLSFPLPLKQ